MTAKIPQCMVMPEKVKEMQPGDEYGVLPAALSAGPSNELFISLNAGLYPVGEGLATVRRACDGLHVDLANVPRGHRFKREAAFYAVHRVQSITGSCCGGV